MPGAFERSLNNFGSLHDTSLLTKEDRATLGAVPRSQPSPDD
jgi:hypothetical protein